MTDLSSVHPCITVHMYVSRKPLRSTVYLLVSSYSSYIATYIMMHSQVESAMTPTAVFLPPTVIPGLSDDGTVNIKSNSSFPSAILSLITSTLTLATVIPPANVAVSVAVLKSTPPVSQTLFSQHVIIHTHYYLEHQLVFVLME